MSTVVTVFVVSECFDGEMAELLAFSTYKKAFKGMESEYLNTVKEYNDAGSVITDQYICVDGAVVKTEEAKHVWKLNEVVVDGFEFHIAKHDVELSRFALKSANKKLESSEMYTQQIARDNYDIIHNPNVRIKYPTLFREVSEHDKSSTSSWYDLSSKAYSEWQEYVKDKSIGYIK